MTTPSALHSKKTPNWGTPEQMVELARQLLGYIHLDPASSEEFNCIVRALMIYRKQDNGLAPEAIWAGNIFLNPPGGLVNEFWRKLCQAIFVDKTAERAFWVGFSVEQLCTLASEAYHPMDFSTCILRKRLSFNQQIDTPILGDYTGTRPTQMIYVKDMTSGNRVERLMDIIGWQPPEIIKGDSPSHGNYVTAINCDHAEFERLFSPLGKVTRGKLA